MSNCSITPGCVRSVSTPNPSASSSTEMSGCTQCLSLKSSSSCGQEGFQHPAMLNGASTLPCWNQCNFSPRLVLEPWQREIPHQAQGSVLHPELPAHTGAGLPAQLHICPFLWPFHRPRCAEPTKPGTGLSFTFPRVERPWPIFIAANQASSALDALRKIAEAFLSPGLFIIHQIGFQLPPSILCVVFPKIWILVYDEVLL